MDIWVILEYTITATVVGLLIGLVKLVFHDKLDARWHYLIWLVLLVRLLVPVRRWQIPSILSVFQEIPVGKWMEMARILAEKNGYGNVLQILGWVYLWGACLLGIFYLVMWLILRIQAARLPEAGPELREYVDNIAVKYGLTSCRRIRIQKTGTPYICGLICPVLVLPEPPPCDEHSSEPPPCDEHSSEPPPCDEHSSEPPHCDEHSLEPLCEKPSPGEASCHGFPPESVILHELIHRKHKDVLVNLILHAVRAVNWFNPLIWILTSIVQNDSEALCDQRVLEYCGVETARDYGKLLISIGERSRGNPVKIGTSNMASSYRNMRTRIRRIRDFRKVPRKIGLVTFCITLILAVAGIGASAEEGYFEIPRIETEQDLERALLTARCYHASTPYEAVYLFLLSHAECSTVYRMAVMAEAELPRYEEFATEWYRQQDVLSWEDLRSPSKKAYPAYFSREISGPGFTWRIYNLQCDGDVGTAAVCAWPSRNDEELPVEWKLSLKKENGWKVWLEEEQPLNTREYLPGPLVYGSRRLGDYQIELSGYSEGYFQQLESLAGGGIYLWGDGQQEETGFPQCFSMEYKWRRIFLTYLGEESISGSIVRIETEDCEGRDADGVKTFSGAELMTGEAACVLEEGIGSPEAGYGWNPGERMGIHVRIYVDGRLAEEGDVWSQEH